MPIVGIPDAVGDIGQDHELAVAVGKLVIEFQEVGVGGDAVVIAAQHTADVVTPDGKFMTEEAKNEVIAKVALPIIGELADKKTRFTVNGTGKFLVAGPQADSGLTGRKIIVDTYGGWAVHGGGAFSGKDPTKVDRSAAYVARYIAKNIVAAGLADRAEVQLAYAIGVAEPVSVLVETFGTGKISQAKITELVRKNFSLTPKGIIESLNLRRPIYRQTAAYGHFGRDDKDFTWESTHRAAELAEAAGIGAAAVA